MVIVESSIHNQQPISTPSPSRAMVQRVSQNESVLKAL
jgi:hypothetical protein